MTARQPDGARRGVLDVLGGAVLFGTAGTSAAFAPVAAGAVALGAARLVIGGLGLLVVLPLLGGRPAAVAALWRTPVGLFAGAMTALYQLAFFAGVSVAGVATGTLVAIGAGPVLVGLISWLALRERPSRAWWTSTAVCLTGLSLLAFDRSGQVDGAVGGLVFSFVAALAWAAYTVAAKRLLRGGAAPSEAMAATFGLGGMILLPVLALAGTGWLVSLNGLVVALWLGLATTTLGYVLFGRGLRRLPAGPAATLLLAEPLVATLLGVALLGERLGPPGWLGAALVALGLGLQGVASIEWGIRRR